MRDPHQVLRRFLRSEKGAGLSETANQYFFDVELHANKIEIKRAVETVYNVKVSRVNTQVVKGKPKTVRQVAGYKSDWKKAIVTLNAGQKIDLAT